jgi:hypothetical protein
MGYVIAAILVVLIVGAGIMLWVRSATTRKGQAQIASPDEPASPGVGGEGEGGVGGEGEGSRPGTASERLANRPR